MCIHIYIYIYVYYVYMYTHIYIYIYIYIHYVCWHIPYSIYHMVYSPMLTALEVREAIEKAQKPSIGS